MSLPGDTAATSRHDEFGRRPMRVEEQGRGEEVESRRHLRTFGIVLGVVCGTSVLGLATWFLVAHAPKQGLSLRNQPQAVPSQGAPPANPPAEPLKDFVSAVLGDTEDVWREQFRMRKQAYKE